MDRQHRFVNNNDVVPRLPPEPAYHHVRTMHYIDASGKLRDSMSPAAGLVDRAKGATADPLAPGTDGIRDHGVKQYLKALEQNLG
ncbi:hypothetical protein ABIA38_002420 [Embleya sp. AB8]